MTRKQRFFAASVISSLTWIITIFYVFGYNVTRITSNGDWIPLEPPRALVMLATIIAMTVSFVAWRWYKQDRVERALSGLNSEEMHELRTRLTAEENLSINDDGEYEVVLSPRKHKLMDGEESF